ncbi:MAG: hypothetical protein M0T77_07085 [Actinomycetota bacterium]|nr:hypothetical protein [Actinomycetota bacterium]
MITRPSGPGGIAKVWVVVPRLFLVSLPVSDAEAAASFYAHLLETAGVRVSSGRHYLDAGGTTL